MFKNLNPFISKKSFHLLTFQKMTSLYRIINEKSISIYSKGSIMVNLPDDQWCWSQIRLFEIHEKENNRHGSSGTSVQYPND